VIRAERAQRAKHSTEKEISVEPTDAPDGPAQDGREAVSLSSPRTDSGDHPDLQRVGEHPTHHQSDT
jgi:hypothetical protein